MTLDEAIVHCEDVAQQNETLANQYSKKEQNHPVERWDSCEKCASEHRQLAEWLKDYKRLKEQESKTEQFAKWVATEIFDDDWEYNKETFAELACRKLAKLGFVKEVDGEWVLAESEDKGC